MRPTSVENGQERRPGFLYKQGARMSTGGNLGFRYKRGARMAAGYKVRYTQKFRSFISLCDMNMSYQESQ
jgi:hypothetical protein